MEDWIPRAACTSQGGVCFVSRYTRISVKKNMSDFRLLSPDSDSYGVLNYIYTLYTSNK